MVAQRVISSVPSVVEGFCSGEPHPRFPQLDVTSDLVPFLERADYRQGGGGRARSLEKGRKFFVVKILTSNP
jgi:hypothetical protein